MSAVSSSAGGDAEADDAVDAGGEPVHAADLGVGPPAPQRRYWSPWRVLFLLVSALTLYLLLPKILNVLDAFDELQTISWPWFVVMLGFEVGSYACMWWL